MKIPFTKAHGARNDFLLTRRRDLGVEPDAALARAICDRHAGIGADGWLIVDEQAGVDARIALWNSDGSTSPISGNGTRCAAAFLIDGGNQHTLLRIATGAGVKELRLLDGHRYAFEMNMGEARIDESCAVVQGHDAVILDVGNPQCAVFVDNFDFDWAAVGAAIERDPRFHSRTNVSFIKVLDRNTLDVRFFERGAGVTMSSGTGSTGAGAAAAARGLVHDRVEVKTPAGPLQLRWQGRELLLAGPAEIIANGEFHFNP